ncbi:hypothetical protein M2140_000078 [Clostridiales Family XIII bacterium PM5-7]
MKKKYVAEWTGCYPALCAGEWTLEEDGIDISKMIPEDLRNSPMYTFGEYSQWEFIDWQEQFSDYVDGLNCQEWVEENFEWLSKITTHKSEMEDIFLAFQEEDWRSGSCGGCI